MTTPSSGAAGGELAGRQLDRRIVALAVPALGSLIAEPLYLLVDSAIVGHLGRTEFGALGIAAQVMLTVVGLCVFLAYGTTTAVARAQTTAERAGLGIQGLWLGAATGALVGGALLAFADPLATLIGSGERESSELAARYLRLSAIGVAAQLVAIAGQGWLRGEQRLGVALRLVIAAQLVNLLATVVLVYGAGLGLDGAALGTVGAQLAFAGATVWLAVREARRHGAALGPRVATLLAMSRFGGLLIVRSASLVGAYLLLAALAARISDPAVSAQLLATQLLWLCALALDALAIAAQVLVSDAIGRGDRAAVRSVSLRVLWWSCGWGVALAATLALIGPHAVARVFSPDPAVAEAAAQLWPWFCTVQVLGGVVFALDGILIGLEDGVLLAASTVVGAAALVVTVALAGGGSLTVLWGAVAAMFAARAAVLAARAARPGGPLSLA